MGKKKSYIDNVQCSRKDHDCFKCVPGLKISDFGNKLCRSLDKADVKYKVMPICPKRWLNSQVHKDVVAFLKEKERHEKNCSKHNMFFKAIG